MRRDPVRKRKLLSGAGLLLALAAGCGDAEPGPAPANPSEARLARLEAQGRESAERLSRIEAMLMRLESLEKEFTKLAAAPPPPPPPPAAPKGEPGDEIFLAPDPAEEDLNRAEEMLDRARDHAEEAPAVAARIAAEVARRYPFAESGLRARGMLRVWGLTPEEAGAADEAALAALAARVRQDRLRRDSADRRLDEALHRAAFGEVGAPVRILREVVRVTAAAGGPAGENDPAAAAARLLDEWGAGELDLEKTPEEELARTIGPAVAVRGARFRAGWLADHGRLEEAAKLLREAIEKHRAVPGTMKLEEKLREVEEALRERRGEPPRPDAPPPPEPAATEPGAF